jgi:Xaa-Pro aminopeptidase
MSPKEIEWVNAYHAEVWDKVSPRLDGAALEWLRASTAPLHSPQLVVAAA